MRLCETGDMFNQEKIDQFRQWRASNYEREMGGVTTGFLAVIRWIFLAVTIWGCLVIGLVIFIAMMKIAGASRELAVISFYGFILIWFCFSFTNFYSPIINRLVAFFEGGLLPQGIGAFLQPVETEIHTAFIDYISPILGVPTTPPRSIA